jgi:hypothetical protein
MIEEVWLLHDRMTVGFRHASHYSIETDLHSRALGIETHPNDGVFVQKDIEKWDLTHLSERLETVSSCFLDTGRPTKAKYLVSHSRLLMMP